jgi:hypothetical protein
MIANQYFNMDLGWQMVDIPYDAYTGWWFGTFFNCPFHIWDVILPN